MLFLQMTSMVQVMFLLFTLPQILLLYGLKVELSAKKGHFKAVLKAMINI